MYAQLTMRVGPEAVRKEAHAMGITSPLDALPSIGLGALRLGVSPLEMAHAYATLANGGARIGGSVAFRTPEPGEQYDPSADPISITKVIARERQGDREQRCRSRGRSSRARPPSRSTRSCSR